MVTESRPPPRFCTATIRTHVEALTSFVDAGFDTVYVNQIGKEQQGFCDFYRTEILPRLRA
ncbi:hypothetical protein [Streptomyces phaeolivaceus]|uniref:hypothetical protein n=1 Tax=Streptomyces phaeolivaceus TaxID=2653200 RepID=UPI00384C278F